MCSHPLYFHRCVDLCQIAPELLSNQDMSVTIFDVAQAAGVSYGTVSRVLNGKKNVSDSAREQVMKAVEALGYVANRQAQTLAGGRPSVVGLLVRDVATGYIGEIVAGVDEELMAHGYDLMLQTTHRVAGDEKKLADMFSSQLASGLIVVLPRHPESYLGILRQRSFPCVLVDHQGIGMDVSSVGASNFDGAVSATEYLIGLGHRRIGFISGTRSMGCASERLRGFEWALKKNGLRGDPKLIATGDFQQQQGYACARELLSLRPRPTALFASNDVMAYGAMEAARELGLRIPEDISIIGFDDVPQSEAVHPPLTTVRQPLKEMGRSAARMLVKRIAGADAGASDPVSRIELPTSLTIRQSCASRRPQ
jgi:LacI family transcriptional regulator